MYSRAAGAMMTASDALRETWAVTSAEAALQGGYYRRRVPFPSALAVYAGVVRPGSTSLDIDRG